MAMVEAHLDEYIERDRDEATFAGWIAALHPENVINGTIDERLMRHDSQHMRMWLSRFATTEDASWEAVTPPVEEPASGLVNSWPGFDAPRAGAQLGPMADEYTEPGWEMLSSAHCDGVRPSDAAGTNEGSPTGDDAAAEQAEAAQEPAWLRDAENQLHSTEAGEPVAGDADAANDSANTAGGAANEPNVDWDMLSSAESEDATTADDAAAAHESIVVVGVTEPAEEPLDAVVAAISESLRLARRYEAEEVALRAALEASRLESASAEELTLQAVLEASRLDAPPPDEGGVPLVWRVEDTLARVQQRLGGAVRPVAGQVAVQLVTLGSTLGSTLCAAASGTAGYLVAAAAARPVATA